ncbi:MAG: hypothetical protein ABEJ04_04200 [Halobacteriaceae archaeon]
MSDAPEFDAEVPFVDRLPRETDPSPPEHGRAALADAVAAAGGSVRSRDSLVGTERRPAVLAGLGRDDTVSRVLEDPPTDPEALRLEWTDPDGEGPVLVVAGGDERGLTYALLELAERVEAGGLDALGAVEALAQTPDNEVRGVDRFVEGPVADGWLYDREFWASYLDRLARARFNRFVLTVGYDTAFFSPPYPFVVDVPGYPDVRVSGEVDVDAATHRELLRDVGRMCHERGLEFVFATWQQRPWSANPDTEIDASDQGMLVEGLPEDADAYADYCATGIRELLGAVPEIDGVQLRVNFESGVGDRSTAEGFWREMIRGVAAADDARDPGRGVHLDLRAKGLTDDLLRFAEETGLDVTVPTKFWCESTGLPYHGTQMRSGELANLDDLNRRRRYGYADLLHEPRFYDVLYRLWVSGTNRVFVWGDPDYARRFSRAAGFGDATGFEVTTPLSLKGGHYFLQEADWDLHADADLRHYEWEDERYWAWYRLFGRLGYDADEDAAVWERAFRERFGDAAPALLDAYRAASRVLPLLTACHLTRHPALVNWAELDTGGALFADHNYNESFGDVTYATAEPSDPGLFYGVDEFVEDLRDGEFRNAYSPLQVARWYDALAADVRAALGRAERGGEPESAEYAATAVDLRMLADLATYHAAKTRAAVALCLSREDGDDDALAEAHARAVDARAAWESLAERGEAYHDDLVFGMGPDSADEGHWRDRLAELDADVATLRERLVEADRDPDADASGPVAALESSPRYRGRDVSVAVEAPETHPAGEDLPVVARVGGTAGVDGLDLHYRRADQTEGAFRTVAMTPDGDGAYRATVPGEYVAASVDLLVYVGTTDEDGDALLSPGVFDATRPAPYLVVETRPAE